MRLLTNLSLQLYDESLVKASHHSLYPQCPQNSPHPLQSTIHLHTHPSNPAEQRLRSGLLPPIQWGRSPLQIRYSLPHTAVQFDGQFFFDIFYEYEVNYVFLPGFVSAIRLLRYLLTVVGMASPAIHVVVVLVLNKALVVYAAT